MLYHAILIQQICAILLVLTTRCDIPLPDQFNLISQRVHDSDVNKYTHSSLRGAILSVPRACPDQVSHKELGIDSNLCVLSS